MEWFGIRGFLFDLPFSDSDRVAIVYKLGEFEARSIFFFVSTLLLCVSIKLCVSSQLTYCNRNNRQSFERFDLMNCCIVSVSQYAGFSLYQQT